jgi:hypothetical protein
MPSVIIRSSEGSHSQRPMAHQRKITLLEARHYILHEKNLTFHENEEDYSVMEC